MVPEEYHKYLSLFDEKKSERFPPARTWDHKIEMKPTFEPKAFKPYKLSFAEIKEQEKFIEENLRKGYIKHLKSPMASSFFFVAKKDGKLRLPGLSLSQRTHHQERLPNTQCSKYFGQITRIKILHHNRRMTRIQQHSYSKTR